MAEDRFISPGDEPTAAERELLNILDEEVGEIVIECGHIIQRLGKILRFGKDEIQPGQDLTNTERLEIELGDLHAIEAVLVSHGLLDRKRIDAWAAAKRPKLNKYLQRATLQPEATDEL